jgi:hypothetical protein
MNIKYTIVSGRRHVESVNGFNISPDKHAYRCKICSAIFESKNITCRSIFPTNDPKCIECNKMEHYAEDLERVCECEPVIRGSWI